MKVGDYEKINESCGFACVKNEVTNDEWIVVYAKIDRYREDELGQVIGKGRSREEALIETVKFFMRREEVYETSLEEKEENATNILHKMIVFLTSRALTNQSEVVLPVKAWTHDYKKGYYETGEMWNADIFIDSDGKAQEGTL